MMLFKVFFHLQENDFVKQKFVANSLVFVWRLLFPLIRLHFISSVFEVEKKKF